MVLSLSLPLLLVLNHLRHWPAFIISLALAKLNQVDPEFRFNCLVYFKNAHENRGSHHLIEYLWISKERKRGLMFRCDRPMVQFQLFKDRNQLPAHPQQASKLIFLKRIKMAHPINFLPFAVTKIMKTMNITTPMVSQCSNAPECSVYMGSPTPCLIILVTFSPMDIVWYYGVRGVLMKELILNAKYTRTHPPLVSLFWWPILYDIVLLGVP